MSRQPIVLLLCVALVAFFSSCTSSDPAYPDYGSVPPFLDQAPSNMPLDAGGWEDLQFVGIDGEPTDLKQYLGMKHVVLVVTRGLTGTLDPQAKGLAGGICVYCATQTSRIAANYPQFQERNAEVVIVFPVVKPTHATRVGDFRSAVRAASTDRSANPVPFPLVLDVELKAVDQLGIRKDLSKPATYVIDKEGKLRYAYVGKTLADRPSVKAILAELDQINRP